MLSGNMLMEITTDHRMTAAQWLPSSHCGPRPYWAQVELIVLHCVSLPEGQYGTGAPRRLFTGELDCQEHPSFSDLEGLEVAPRLLIERDGELYQFVAFDQQAWHAGESSWCGRAGCNRFSIGIELEGCVADRYTEMQYQRLRRVLKSLIAHYPALSPERIVGHSDIAPGRKFDPGPQFNWSSVLPYLWTSLLDSKLY